MTRVNKSGSYLKVWVCRKRFSVVEVVGAQTAHQKDSLAEVEAFSELALTDKTSRHHIHCISTTLGWSISTVDTSIAVSSIFSFGHVITYNLVTEEHPPLFYLEKMMSKLLSIKYVGSHNLYFLLESKSNSL